MEEQSEVRARCASANRIAGNEEAHETAEVQGGPCWNTQSARVSMMISVGDTVRYRNSEDRVEVHARVERIDKVLGRLLVSWADGREREWIDATDVFYQRHDSVVVDGEITGVVRHVDRDGDVVVRTNEGTDLWYRTRLAKAKG